MAIQKKSWCQVAAECMPSQSIIIGVDLAPIKPIPKVITFQSDITTDKCRATIRQHLKSWKADTVLHDGAPNVGVAWVQDAFSQAELVLQSLKLATEFLVPGGTFVTKVFRSKDYNPLLWVFKQLFNTVEATKPPSSRNVSAEIFVVCQGFKAPKHIDQKFLDPKHVFAELQDPTPNHEAKVFNPEKKKRKRDGYEEGNYTQFKEIPVSEFINTADPISILGEYNKLSFEQSIGGDLALATLARLPETTKEIQLCCEDLKVLGKKEFRNLLRWRIKVREKFGLSVKKGPSKPAESEEVAEVEPMDEELAIQEDLQRLRDKETSRRKKERRRENERKHKEIVRMQMHMTTPMDIGIEQSGPLGEGAMFALKPVKRAGDVSQITSGKMVPIESDEDEEDDDSTTVEDDSDEEEDRLERELDSMYERYRADREDRDAKLRAKKARKEFETEEWEGISDSDKEGDEDTDGDDARLQDAILRPTVDSKGLSNRAAMFFDQDIFQDLGDLGDKDEEDVPGSEDGSATRDQEDITEDEEGSSDASNSVDDVPEIQIPAKLDRKQTTEKRESTRKMNSKGNEIHPEFEEEERQDPRKKNGQLDIDIITAEAMALAQQIAMGEKTTHDVVDDGFNRYTFRDTDGLPEWFLDDEGKHSKPLRPITAAAAAAIREKMRAINARPIKKVLEAKGRKKFKAAQRLEKLRKKSALLAEDEAMSEKDKAQTIARMMSRAMKKKPKQTVKLVVAKGANRGISGRPKGIKGRYKIVDSRMKKDIRAEKRLAKKRKKN
ncbi:AdoMet-dependent rRNA methyltransferase SPB1 [Histoplasma capsulatum H143]|uniref:AdoMet-dependent rRNA methyltransferase SPB1 n=1 Tax=Ajellomyces capsulatus (strain H143) TaxID=544712 RepID=C6HKW7_AJECH|nr:AdoMet-dependent rRNA methyltransferase SPB1 [Histoplasma capsulatum H143]